MNHKKHYGIVYTPQPIVDIMLDNCPDLMGKKICDPACGDGQFLVSIVERICAKLHNGYTHDAVKTTLENIFGFDIDETILEACRARLDKTIASHGIKPIKWNLYQMDALDTERWSVWMGHFDCVIGNPPYVRVQHLEKERRDKIKTGGWSFMSGSTDLFLLFFDMGLRLLKDNGHLIFITPNTWMKSITGQGFRKYLQNFHKVQSIYDFGEHQVFDSATTYTAITSIKRGAPVASIIPVKKCIAVDKGYPKLKGGYSIHIKDSSWVALSEEERAFLDEAMYSPYKLSEVASIHVGIQTLADKIFIVPDNELDMESGILKRIYKASVMKNGKDSIDRSIIYPYEEGRLIPEEKLADCYPKAYDYLNKFKSLLLERDKGAIPAHKWYAFGRGVSIVSGFGEKILTSSMNKTPNFHYCDDKDALYYSGYCVKPLKGVNVKALVKELNSEKMETFIRLTSRPYQSGWYSYAKSFIQSFPVTEAVYGYECA